MGCQCDYNASALRVLCVCADAVLLPRFLTLMIAGESNEVCYKMGDSMKIL